jgi:hypothetical protein
MSEIGNATICGPGDIPIMSDYSNLSDEYCIQIVKCLFGFKENFAPKYNEYELKDMCGVAFGKFED